MIVHENFPLSSILYYKIGGSARYVLKIENEQDVDEALSFIKEKDITNVLPIGIGANLLVSDDPFDGAVLWFAKPQKSVITKIDDGLITIFAAQLLDDVIQYSFQNNLIGIAWAGGLPSTIGAAVRGNVGCFGKEIKDVFHHVDVIDIKTYEKKTLFYEDMHFAYRETFIKENPNLLIVNVYLKLEKGTSEEMQKAHAEYDENIMYRKTHHPIEYPSCGSVFKNIIGKEEVDNVLQTWPDITDQVRNKWHGKVAMGYVTKRLRLGNLQIGDAEVSQKHANYIINKGNASFDDVYAIIEKIKNTFFDTFGFYPEPEVQIIQ